MADDASERLDTPAPRSKAMARTMMRQRGLGRVYPQWNELAGMVFIALLIFMPLIVMVTALVASEVAAAHLGAVIVDASIGASALAGVLWIASMWEQHVRYVRLFRLGTLVPARVTRILHPGDTVQDVTIETVDGQHRYGWRWRKASGVPYPAWCVEGAPPPMSPLPRAWLRPRAK
jgi:hypothetical protein